MDTTPRLTNMPKPGKTVHAHEIFRVSGGKGVNQAVAAKRSDAWTSFIGGVGADSKGQQLLDLLIKGNIDTPGIAEIQGTTIEQAMIMVDAAGEDGILIHVRASNASYEQEVLKNKQPITNSDFIITQFESSLDTTILAFPTAENAGKTTVLSLAPAHEAIPTELLGKTGVIISNEVETEVITEIRVTNHNSLVAATEKLYELGIGTVTTTLGSAGASYYTEKEHGIAPALKVDAADTTAAGGTFIGTLSNILQLDFSDLKEAVLYGSLASPVTVQSYGAQPPIPYRKTLE